MRLQRALGQVVLITGAGSGIGRAAALAFAREGATLALMGRRREPLEALMSEVTSQWSCPVDVFPGDVTQASNVRATVDACLTRFARLDALINCAGVAGPAALTHETDDAIWDELLSVNWTGTFRMSRAALGPMIEQGGGAIVNVASIAGLVGITGLAAYGVAKGGVIALTRTVAAEYGLRGIRCNCVCPGTVATPMTAAALARASTRAACEAANPMRRIGSAEEIAETILHLGSPESSFINGAVLSVDGGYTAL